MEKDLDQQFEYLKIDANIQDQFPPVEKWNDLISCLSEVNSRIPTNRWLHDDLIVDHEKPPSILHFRTDSSKNSFISNRNNFFGNGSTENKDLIISSASSILLQTGNNEKSENRGFNRIKVNRYGNVGVGLEEEEPQSTLHIKGNADVLNLEGDDHVFIQFYPRKYSGESRGWIGFGSGKPANQDKMSMMNLNNAPLAIGINNEDALIIEPSGKGEIGNVKIGTPRKKRRLHVKGNAEILTLEGDDHAFIQFYPQKIKENYGGWIGFGSGEPSEKNKMSILNLYSGQLVLGTNKNEALHIDPNGNVRIGAKVPSESYKLNIGGDLKITNGSLYTDNAVMNSLTTTNIEVNKGGIINGNLEGNGVELGCRIGYDGYHRISFKWTGKRDGVNDDHELQIFFDGSDRPAIRIPATWEKKKVKIG